MSRFTDILRDFADNTTAHGIGRISSSKSIWLRLLWLLAFLASLAVFIWQICNLIKYYYSRPIAIETKIAYGTVDFPSVTFCNLNPLRNSKLSLGDEGLQETLKELGANIKSELTGESSETRSRKKRYIQDGRPVADEHSSYLYEEYPTYNIDAYEVQPPLYGFLSSKKVQYEHRVKRGLPSWAFSSESSEDILSFFDDHWGSSSSSAEELVETSWTSQNASSNGSIESDMSAWQSSSGNPFQGSWNNSISSVNSTASSHNETDLNSQNYSQSSLWSPSETGESSLSSRFHTQSSIDSTWLSTGTSPPNKFSQYDPGDDYYVPEVDLSDKPWFTNNIGSMTAEVRNTRKLSEALSETPLSVRRAMGYQIDGMLQECTWNGRICTPLNFSSFYNKKYGNCFTFNSGFDTEIRKMEKNGALYGLTMTLFVDQSEYIDSFTSGVGVRLLIHRPDEQPFPEDNGFTVIPGLKTSVSLNNRRYDRLPEPFSNCTNGTTNETFMFNKNYSVLGCLKSCSQSRKISRCHCADPLLSVSDHVEICTESDTECIDDVDVSIVSGSIKCFCPILCRENLYVSSISTSTWPGEKFLTKVQQLFSGREGLKDAVENASSISENFVKIEVFFDEVKVTQITESQAYGIVQLLADIGGQLGLWIGFSVLTGAEVIQLCVEIIVYLVRRRRGKAKINQSVHKDADTKSTLHQVDTY